MRDFTEYVASPGVNPVSARKRHLLSSALDDLARLDCRPGRVVDINPAALTPFQHALLHIDGTVTRFIEAYQNERTDTILLNQETSRLTAPNPYLRLPTRRTVYLRQVLIRGRTSKKTYVYASSILVQANLSPEMKSILNSENGSLGKMLEICEVENRREMLWYGKESFEKTPVEGIEVPSTSFLTRAYRIIANGKPLVVINEKFPYEHNDERR